MSVVLVIDDDLDIVEAIRMVLEVHGHSVASAGTREEAVSLARAHRPSLTLVDYRIPGIDIPALISALRGAGSERIALCTGAEDADELSRSTGADGFLSKPFAIQELLALLR